MKPILDANVGWWSCRLEGIDLYFRYQWFTFPINDPKRGETESWSRIILN